MLFTAFRVLFNVDIINTMRMNEEEVQGVSDTLPSTVKAQIKRKQPISEVLENVPACSSSYPLEWHFRQPGPCVQTRP